MKKICRVLVVLTISFCLACPAWSGDGEDSVPSELIWPKVIDSPRAKIVIYQPQLEDLSENYLKSRFAASIQAQDMDEPVFGAVWAKAKIETRRDERTVHLIAIEDVHARFPDSTPEQEAWFADVLKQEIPAWDIVLSIDQLISGLETEQERIRTEQRLNNDPPRIIHVNQPAVLVTVDGEPVLQPIENTGLMAVVNTPFPMVFRTRDKTYYLIGKDAWYHSKTVAGQWQETASPPSDVAALEREADEDDEAESSVLTGMAVFGATEPTELLSVDGMPQMVPFKGNHLMYVRNTDNNLLYEVNTGQYYLLLSGRWFCAKGLDGPWAYVMPDHLPESFRDIPAASVKGELRASIPGTDEAREAVWDAQIPETAVVKRSEAELVLEYDGSPKFASIDGTRIEYAVNTATPVIRVQGRYYAVDNGIWFAAPTATGPWTVADSVPDEVQDIPPSSPVNHIKYVYIYDSTPEVVYVGYTPGYTGCYVQHGIVVYGTGYHYRPWYRHYYYPRPLTYGFGVCYSPYYGWSFGVSFFHGPFSFYFGRVWGPPRHGGWWGPPRYRPPYHRPPHYRPPVHRPPSNRPPSVKPPGKGKPAHLPAGQRPKTRPAMGNIYGKQTADRGRPASGTPGVGRPAGKPAALPNDVFTDRQGNVYRRGQNGWEQRQNGQWKQKTDNKSVTPVQRPAGSGQTPSQRPAGSVQRPSQQPAAPGQGQTRPGNVQQPTGRPAQNVTRQPAATPRTRPGSGQSLNRQQQGRERGNQRTNQFYQNQQRRRGGAATQRGAGTRNIRNQGANRGGGRQ